MHCPATKTRLFIQVTHVSAVKHVLHTGMHAVQVGEVLKKPVRQAVQITVPFNLQV